MMINWFSCVSIAYIVAIFVTSCASQSCTQLLSPVNGKADCTGSNINDRCTLTCDQGYELVSASTEVRRCVCPNVAKCYWTGSTAYCQEVRSFCPIPNLMGNTYNVVDMAPSGVIVRVTIQSNVAAFAGWSTIVIFKSPLYQDAVIESYSAKMSAVSADRKAFTFTNRPYNQDISARQQYAFTFIVTGTNLMSNPALFTATVGFYSTLVSDGSCFLSINPINPISSTIPSKTTTPTQSVDVTSAVSTTTTKQSTSTISTTTTTQRSSTTHIGIQDGCTEIEYKIDNPGWKGQDGTWNFIFRYFAPQDNYNDWTIKIVFSKAVSFVEAYDSIPNGPHTNSMVWFLTPKSWNKQTKAGQTRHFDAIGKSKTSGDAAPEGVAILCNDGVVPNYDLIPVGGTTESTSSSLVSTETSTTITVPPGTLTPNGPTGRLPNFSSQTMIDYKPSSVADMSRVPYDYNEILHKSILFYEAQRSGPLPDNNRIPWRGDSGLRDGCYNGKCIDLTGGWYDAGDFVKFGFPMAFSTTVLAWGMIEFRDAYLDAEEWDNALDMLKWGTDYFLKAHVSKSELYVQVGDPTVDHSNWGHPETMTMDRPVYKIDPSNPGSEVAAETAAALAASYLVFEDLDRDYADLLLENAVELYNFSETHTGNYHESLPESHVRNYYKSWSGYDDELMWASMWLYRATNKIMFLNKALTMAASLEFNSQSFSWDQKSPGVLVLLSQSLNEYKETLWTNLDRVIYDMPRTPQGLTFFSEWGPNRYSANYALIALMAAKIEGSNNALSANYLRYATEQIHKMLGEGDNSRSYVVGYGKNPPQRPHHRASSCRKWTLDPSSRVCNWFDRDSSDPNPQIIYGALVGGPSLTGAYTDDRRDYISNEVALDYNAGFQTAIAGLKYFLMQQRR